jgi:hypothetical protein
MGLEWSADQSFRMLEDPSYSSVVRWGDEMDSFVVLEVYNHSMSTWPGLAADILNRMNALPRRYSPNISSIATSPVS